MKSLEEVLALISETAGEEKLGNNVEPQRFLGEKMQVAAGGGRQTKFLGLAAGRKQGRWGLT